MLRIRRGPVWCKVDADTLKHYQWAHAVLTVQTTRWGRRGMQTYEMHLLHYQTGRMPAGLISYLLERAEAASIPVRLIDERPPMPEVGPLPARLGYLYDYQREAIDICIEKRSGVIKCPTGGGKTLIAVGLAARLNCGVLFLADERALVQQSRERWERAMGEPAGIIGEGQIAPARFTVGSIQSVRKHREKLERYLSLVDCLIVDEVHTAGARTYYETIMNIPASVRIGLSATPIGRSDRKDAYVIGATGPVIFELPIQELVDRGKLAKSMILFYDYPGAKPIQSYARIPWHKLYLGGVVREQARNRAILRICKITPKPVLIFFERKAHGYMLLSAIKEEGYSAKIVHGDVAGPERIKLAKELGAGKLDVLLCSKVFNKGIDIPEIRSAINAAGYKAKITATQKLGRPMRVADGKDRFIYWDLVDRHHKTLIRHTRNRLETYRAAGLECQHVQELAEAAFKISEFLRDSEPLVAAPDLVVELVGCEWWAPGGLTSAWLPVAA